MGESTNKIHKNSNPKKSKRRGSKILINTFCKKIINLNNSYDFLKKIEIPNHIYHSYYRFYFFVKLNKIRNKITREEIIKLLNSKGIVCNVGSCPEIYLERPFKLLARHKTRLENAKKLNNSSIALCVNHRFRSLEQKHYLTNLKKIFEYISNKI